MQGGGIMTFPYIAGVIGFFGFINDLWALITDKDLEG